MERYFLLSSANTVTIVLSAPCIFCAMTAPRKFAPDETPTPIPNFSESIRAIMIESTSSTETISSISSRWTMLGMNSSEIPCILCAPVLYPVGRVGELSGSNGWILQEGFSIFRRFPIPIAVPPVPTPATMPSAHSPSAANWRTISSPVITICACTLSSLENCFGRNTPPCSASSSVIRIEPKKPPCSLDTRRTSAP